MKTLRILALSSLVAALAACESGDIVLSPTVNGGGTGGGGGGGGGGTTNPCASYTTPSGQFFQGTVDSNGHCFYNSLFVSDTRPITVSDITFPALASGKFHIFEDSLFIGEDVDASAAAAGKRIPQEGEGTRATIAPGSTLVFSQPDSYVRVARGSQIFAEGTAAAPITFTADEDVILSVANESSRGLWGGVQINGNGMTNKCHDGTVTGSSGTVVPLPASDFLPTANNVHRCHVTAEGRPATYGGGNNSENSGVLTYVVIKYAGYEVVDGNELNALTLNAVGNGTTISHVETYTSLDDGYEMFGGAVNMDHIVAVNAGDDSIDYSEGYNGDIQYAIVLHTSGANWCIEADNAGAGRGDGLTPTTKLRISNLTCITSNILQNQGTNPSGKGSSEGVLFREGAFFELYNSLVSSNNVSMASQRCFRVQDTEGPQTIAAMKAGTSRALSNLIMCSTPLSTAPNAANQPFTSTELAAWLVNNPAVPPNTNANNVIVMGAPNIAGTLVGIPGVVVVGGTGTRGYLTAANLVDSGGTTVFNQATQLFNVGALGSIFETPTYLGGASAADDWAAGWTVGLTGALTP
jgi:hypothetical protein